MEFQVEGVKIGELQVFAEALSLEAPGLANLK